MLVRALPGKQGLCRYPRLLRWAEAQGSYARHPSGERACAPPWEGLHLPEGHCPARYVF